MDENENGNKGGHDESYKHQWHERQYLQVRQLARALGEVQPRGTDGAGVLSGDILLQRA